MVEAQVSALRFFLHQVKAPLRKMQPLHPTPQPTQRHQFILGVNQDQRWYIEFGIAMPMEATQGGAQGTIGGNRRGPGLQR